MVSNPPKKGRPPRDLDDAARQKALALPGPSWREYFYYEFLKVWVLLGFFVIDVLVGVAWIQPFNPIALALSFVAAIYLEFLLYRVLWYRPDLRTVVSRAEFRPSWTEPVQYGRWTPEAERVRHGLPPFGEMVVPPARGADPREFL